MVTALEPRYLVDLPAPAPPRYNLLQTASVIDDPDPHWGQGVAARGYPDAEAVAWSSEVGSAVAAKPEHDEDRIVTGKAFTVVWTYGCTRAGMDPADYETRGRAVFAAVEPVAVEAMLWGNPLGIDQHALDYDAPTDLLTILNGGTAVKPVVGLALLEQAAAEAVVSPVIHMRPAVVSLLGEDYYTTAGANTIQSKLGTPIVSGAGYPGTGKNGEAIAQLVEWAYVSGPVVIRRAPVQVLTSFDRSVNDYVLTFERDYLILFDPALRAAVKIDKALA